MTELSHESTSSDIMARPFAVTRSRLGVVTKLFDTNFLCNESSVYDLYGAICEKLNYLRPERSAFQFLISFDDKTHFEHHDIKRLAHAITNNSKVTDRLILKWMITHKLEPSDEPNELTLIVRIANPVNPLMFLQAALSKSVQDIDNLEFEGGSVSVSIDGAGQTTAEEIFAIVGRWIESRPQPQYITSLHHVISNHREKIAFANYWLLPILGACIFFLVLWKHTPDRLLTPVLFSAVIANYYVRAIASKMNEKIRRWCRFSLMLNMFSLTGGDTNQQEKIAAKSKNSSIKLIIVTTCTFVLNVAAGIIASWVFAL